MTSPFDGGRTTRLHNARLSDARPLEDQGLMKASVLESGLKLDRTGI